MIRSWMLSATQGWTGIGVAKPMPRGLMHPEAAPGRSPVARNNQVRSFRMPLSTKVLGRAGRARGKRYRLADWVNFNGLSDLPDFLADHFADGLCQKTRRFIAAHGLHELKAQD